MKKTIIPAIAALALIVPGTVQARDYRHDRPDRRTHVTKVVKVHKTTKRKWQRGQRFDRRYATNYRQVDYRQYRGLRAPPRGYQYVQSGNDVLLVAIASGVIGAVIGGLVN